MKPYFQVTRPFRWGAFLSLLCLSCSSESSPPNPEAIPPGAFATVGGRPLGMSLLANFEAPERQERARAVVRDELMRVEAETVDPVRARVVERGELARRLIEHTESDVTKGGPITEKELRVEYDRRWVDFNRPRALRTVQVFFSVEPPLLDEAQRENAERLWKAVQGTHNLAQFGEAARPILDEVKSAQVYEMPPLTKDGRIVPILPQDRNVTGISKHLAQAVGELESAGDISSVVGTEHGYHVFFVTEVVPEQVTPLSDVRAELERAVLATRVRESLDAISKTPNVPIVRRRSDIANLLTLVQEGQ